MMFDVALWSGDCDRGLGLEGGAHPAKSGVAMHAALLPVLSTIAQGEPKVVTQWVGVPVLVSYLQVRRTRWSKNRPASALRAGLSAKNGLQNRAQSDERTNVAFQAGLSAQRTKQRLPCSLCCVTLAHAAFVALSHSAVWPSLTLRLWGPCQRCACSPRRWSFVPAVLQCRGLSSALSAVRPPPFVRSDFYVLGQRC